MGTVELVLGQRTMWRIILLIFITFFFLFMLMFLYKSDVRYLVWPLCLFPSSFSVAPGRDFNSKCGAT
jgi:hypothetical protein